MGYAFVSYSRRQSAAVDVLIDRLERSGIAVWRDTASMPAGVEWERQVNQAIRGADLVVMCVSELWYGSQPCRDEKDWSDYYHRPQVRVCVEENEFDPQRAVADIGAAWKAITPEDRLAADLETAAGDWMARGAKARDLARGKAFAAYRKVFGNASKTGSGRRFTPVAERYMRQSARHRMVMRIAAMLAAVALICAGVAGMTFATRIRQINETNEQWNTDSKQWDALRAAMLDSPYKAMETALAQPHDAATMRGTMYVTGMRMVLDMHVPDDHGPATDARFAGYDFPAQLNTTAPDGLPVHGAKARGYAVSPDGLAVAALTDGGVRILDAHDGDTMMTLTGVDFGKATSMAWNGDSSALAIRSDDGAATVWKVRSNTTIIKDTGSWFMSGAALGGSASGPSSGPASGSSNGTTGAGSRAALLARDGHITVVDTAKGRVLSDATRVPLDVGVAIAAAPDATDVAYVAGTRGGATALYRVAWGSGDLSGTGKTTRIAVPDGCAPSALAVLPGGREITIGCGSEVDVIDTTTGSPTRRIANESGAEVTAINADTKGRLFVGFDGGVLAVVESGADTFTYPDAASSDAGSLGYCLGGTARAVAVSGSKGLFVGDGTTSRNCSRNISRSKAGDGGSNGVENARRDDGSWTMHAGMFDLAGVTDAHQSRAVAAAPDGNAFAAGLSDGSVMFSRYDMQPGPAVREVSGEVRAVVYAPDGKRVVAATREGLIFSVTAPDAGAYEGATLRRLVSARLDRAVELGLFKR